MKKKNNNGSTVPATTRRIRNRHVQPRHKEANNSTRVLMCILAGVMMSANLSSFVHTGGLLPGGFSGVTLLIQSIFKKFLGVSIPYAPFYLLLNLYPILLGFRKIGKKFTLYSCITILIVAFLTDLLPTYVLTSDILLVSVFGGLVNGLAISICLMAGATSGGTDFISIYISEKYKVDAWNYILIFNAVILFSDGFLFGWDKALYSIIFQYVSTQVINTVYKRYKKNTLFIVTRKPLEIAEMINSMTMHGATELKATGMYEGMERSIIYSVIDSDELKMIMRGIQDVDPKAFVNVLRTDHLSGRYYMRPKD